MYDSFCILQRMNYAIALKNAARLLLFFIEIILSVSRLNAKFAKNTEKNKICLIYPIKLCLDEVIMLITECSLILIFTHCHHLESIS